jgi:cell pole-organizing protein PopZ
VPAERPRVQASLSPSPEETAAAEPTAAAREALPSHLSSVQPALGQNEASPLRQEHSEQAQSLPAKIEEAANLLSVEAGAQVARSFNELAAVFSGLEHRSVEEMAQEMLRPMLQEWLDDNLPTLVEKLVREEIERVARGPRR